MSNTSGHHAPWRVSPRFRIQAGLLSIVALVTFVALFGGWWPRGTSAARTDGAAGATPALDSGDIACPSTGSVFVSPNGQPGNDGSEEHPIDLVTALSAKSPAKPCDTIWLRGGTYRGAFKSALQGAERRPIIVRQYPGERSTIDSAPAPEAALQVTGSWTWYWGFEVTNSDPRRTSTEAGQWPGDLHRGTGVASSGSHVKFINLVVHDLARGFEVNETSVDTEFYGNLIYANGWEGPDAVAQGNGIDTRNQLGPRRIVDNIIFNQFSHGIAIFGKYLDNITLEGNVVFGNGSVSRQGVTESRNILLGGAVIASNPVVRANVTYNGQANLGYAAGCSGATVTDNYFAGPLIWVKCAGALRGNTLYDSSASGYAPLSTQYPHNTYHTARPTGVVVRTRRNRYEEGRAIVAVLNWDRKSEIPINLSEAGLERGDPFEVRDAQNFFGAAVASGTYRGGTIAISAAAGPVAKSHGVLPVVPNHTLPEFGTFVVLKPAPKPGS